MIIQYPAIATLRSVVPHHRSRAGIPCGATTARRADWRQWRIRCDSCLSGREEAGSRRQITGPNSLSGHGGLARRDARWLPAGARILAVGMAMFSVLLGQWQQGGGIHGETQAIALAGVGLFGRSSRAKPRSAMTADRTPTTGNATIRDSRTSARATATSCFGEGARYDGRDATDCRGPAVAGADQLARRCGPARRYRARNGVNSAMTAGPNANDGQCDDARFREHRRGQQQHRVLGGRPLRWPRRNRLRGPAAAGG